MCDSFCTDEERLSTEDLSREKMNQPSSVKISESVVSIVDSTVDKILDSNEEYDQFVDNNNYNHHIELMYDCSSINVENDDDDDECNTTHGEIGIDQDNEEEYDNNSEDGDWCNNDNSYNDELFLLTKPIIVGYAFGPKKMSTMGVVMAEASKTRISATHSARTETTPTSLSASPDFTVNGFNKQSGIQYPNECEHSFISNDSIEDSNNILSVGECLNTSKQRDLCSTNKSLLDIGLMTCLQSINQDTHCNSPSIEQQTTRRRNKRLSHRRPVDECVTFTIDGRMISYSAATTAITQGLHHTYEDNSKNTSIRNIVRRFRSSCSSTNSDDNENDDADDTDDASSSATGTCTASMGSSSQLTTGTTSALASNASSTRRNRFNMENHFPVRVSFVPLDPDSPLEEQHGGKLDVILHKLTEDILYLSQLSSKSIELKKNIEHRDLSNIQLDTLNNCNIDEMAVRRVLRVCHFRTAYPECCIVDDPGRVITLMSRADISKTLQQCLNGVTSTSGIIVESPKFHVVDDYTSSLVDCKNYISNTLQQLSYPIIVKPLCAAGTKASHAMTVIMKPSVLEQIISEKAPCILQEYHNHDAFLYKVYILGDHVSVHKRRSVPNLPHWKNQEHNIDYVEFDSQRPYPRLSDFGYDEGIDDSKYDDTANTTAATTTTTINGCQTCSNVTVEEILPVVNAIRAAFGLQLFGFDVLITTSCSSASRTDVCKEQSSDQLLINQSSILQKKMLVIDVNYFPSYKEVTNFPALLAKYLTDQVLDSRRKMIAAKKEEKLHLLN